MGEAYSSADRLAPDTVAKNALLLILESFRFNEGIDAAKEALQMVEKAGGFRNAAQRHGLALNRRRR